MARYSIRPLRSLRLLWKKGIFFFALVASASGCGYTLQNSRSVLAEKEGVRKIYVAPILNNTYKAGVENIVYNALVRTLSVHRRAVLVTREDEADAVLKGMVTQAKFGPSATVPANQLNPVNTLSSTDRLSTVLVATEYSVALVCSFELRRVHPSAQQKPVVWASSFSRGKPFAAANQLGTLGDTSALINESEFDRALLDLASSMMNDVHESMLAMF